MNNFYSMHIIHTGGNKRSVAFFNNQFLSLVFISVLNRVSRWSTSYGLHLADRKIRGKKIISDGF